MLCFARTGVIFYWTHIQKNAIAVATTRRVASSQLYYATRRSLGMTRLMTELFCRSPTGKLT